MNRRRLAALTPICAASALALAGCTFGGTATITQDGHCTQVSVPQTQIGAVTAPTTLPGVVLAPCPATAAPTTTAAPPPTTTVAPPATTAAPPPTTTTPTTTAAPPTTTAAAPPADDSAATRYNWGAPIAAGSDEFNTNTVDTAKWSLPGECWPANSTVKAGRCASHVTVHDGYLDEHGTSDGKTGWLQSKFAQRYGRYEVRARITTTAPGHPFHPVLMTWPKSDAWPSGGEYDFAETDTGAGHTDAFMHHPNGSQDAYTSPAIDLTAWHDYAFSWEPDGLTGYIDGQVWFHDTDPAAQAPGPMELTMQLDDFVGTSGMADAHLDVDWAHVYGP